MEYEEPVGMGGVQYPGLGEGGGGGNEFRRKDPYKFQYLITVYSFTLSVLVIVQNITQEFRLLDLS